MFPPKSEKRTRKRGVVKPRVTFRVPPDLERYIEAAEEGGYEKTEVIVRMLTLAKDEVEALGADWFEVERLAQIESTRPGIILARLVRQALEKQPK